jgi:hypothetical protein
MTRVNRDVLRSATKFLAKAGATNISVGRDHTKHATLVFQFRGKEYRVPISTSPNGDAANTFNMVTQLRHTLGLVNAELPSPTQRSRNDTDELIRRTGLPVQQSGQSDMHVSATERPRQSPVMQRANGEQISRADEAIRRYQEGGTVGDVAVSFGMTYPQLRHLLEKRGIKIRRGRNAGVATGSSPALQWNRPKSRDPRIEELDKRHVREWDELKARHKDESAALMTKIESEGTEQELAKLDAEMAVLEERRRQIEARRGKGDGGLVARHQVSIPRPT